MSDLRHLISPIDVELFKREYWGKQPLIVDRPDRSHYASLLTLDDVDEILSTSSPLSGQVQAVRDGKARPLAKNPAALGGGGPEGWFEEYRSGSTIVLQSLHERWPSLKRLCRSLAAEFSAGFQVNVYLTPPNAQGLSTHYDTHDVFVVQVAGTKRWRIYERTIELPLYGQASRSSAGETGRVLHELELQAGSAMYLPRGFAHQATSMASASIHLAVGALTVTWASVVLTAVEKVIEQDAQFRSALPPGFAEHVGQHRETEARLADLLHALVEGVDVPGSIADAAERARQALPVDLAGHLRDLEREDTVDVYTRLFTRPDARARVEASAGAVALYFHGKRVSMPEHARAALDFIAATPSFAASELPDVLDEQGKVVLVRRLLREGLLTTANGSNGRNRTG